MMVNFKGFLDAPASMLHFLRSLTFTRVGNHSQLRLKFPTPLSYPFSQSITLPSILLRKQSEEKPWSFTLCVLSCHYRWTVRPVSLSQATFLVPQTPPSHTPGHPSSSLPFLVCIIIFSFHWIIPISIQTCCYSPTSIKQNKWSQK